MKAAILRQHGIIAVELNGVILADEDGTITDITKWSIN